MKKTQKKAFILSECKSPYIQQAIFILKDGFDAETTGIVADAERIVATYMGSTGYLDKKSATKSMLSTIFFSCVGIAILAFCIYVLMK